MDKSEHVKNALLVQQYNEEWDESERVLKEVVKSLTKDLGRTQSDWARLTSTRTELKEFSKAKEIYKRKLINEGMTEALDYSDRYFYRSDSALSKVLNSLSPYSVQRTL